MSVPGVYDAIFDGCTVVFHPAEVFMSSRDLDAVDTATKNLAGMQFRSISSRFRSAFQPRFISHFWLGFVSF